MNRAKKKLHTWHRAALFSVLIAVGCTGESAAPEEHKDDTAEEAAPQSNRTDLPQTVRENLGISFAKAEYRAVKTTISLPGRFEVLPTGQQHYPLPVAGRITMRVSPMEMVEVGQVLFEIDAPDWREMQLQFVEAQAQQLSASAKLTQAQAAKLAAGKFAQSTGEAPNVFTAAIQAAQADVDSGGSRLQQLLAKASTMTSITTLELSKKVGGQPLWLRMNKIPVLAASPGIVREVDAASGTWVDAGTEIVHVLQPGALRFHAKALQADLIDHIRDGQRAAIVPPIGRGDTRLRTPIVGILQIGITGDVDSRTTDVYINSSDWPEWARPQLMAIAEISTSKSTPNDLAIPARAIIQDGLEHVYFVRAFDNPDQVIRKVADLGATNGRWTIIQSGLAEGDEVVVDGIYSLKLATTGQKVKAGHFHSDGSFHDEEH